MLFRQRLLLLRLNRNETQEDVAAVIGVGRTTYAGYEQGREPDYATLSRISSHFKVSTDYLLGLSDNPINERNLTKDEQEYILRSLEVYRSIKLKYQI